MILMEIQNLEAIKYRIYIINSNLLLFIRLREIHLFWNQLEGSFNYHNCQVIAILMIS